MNVQINFVIFIYKETTKCKLTIEKLRGILQQNIMIGMIRMVRFELL